MRSAYGLGRAAAAASALVLTALALAMSGANAPAAVGVFSLDRLLQTNAGGAEDYLYTAGDVIYPDGGVDPATYYKFVVTDATGANHTPAFPCTPAASFPSADNTYTVQAADPVSTGTSWKYTLQQFTNSSCTGTPAKTTNKLFYVVAVTIYGDSALTTQKDAFGSSATAYVVVRGVKTGKADWSTTWLLPSGAIACANTAGADQPDATNAGVLPKTGGGFLQYRPNTTNTGSNWNWESNYETRPCPALQAANEGRWTLRIATDATNFVTLPVFRVDATAPPAPTISSGPSGSTNATTATFVFSDSEAGVTFLCRLDGVSFVACTSPTSYSGLASGNHSFEVKARDEAGNESAVTSRSWVVDATPPPAPSITSGPSGTSNSTSATLAFSDTESGVTFVCQLDSGGFTACTSPTTYGALTDGSHTFDVKAVDAAGNNSSATSRTWTVDTVAPPAPSIDSGPTGTTPSTDAEFTFSDGEAGVAFRCELDGGGFNPCTSPRSYSGLAEGAHAFHVKAVDDAGNESVAATRSWTIDSAGPAVTITSGPADPTSSTSASFSFTSDPGATFACQLDGGGFGPCTSPKSYSGLGDGLHTFEVKATDGAGNEGAPASRSWTVDTVAPTVSIVSGPADPTNATSASFSFTASETGVSFTCQLDGGAFSACTSPQVYGPLGDGPHSFHVQAVDAAGNVGVAAEALWTIDTVAPPAPSIDSGPTGTTPSTDAEFTFSDGEAGVAFRCELDGGGFNPCTSPRSYSGLAEGAHAFHVKAVDDAGNESVAATRSWTIESTGPAVTITSGPADPTSSTSASFSFTSDPGATFACQLDGGGFGPCTSPKSYSGLGDGLHTFEVKATDGAGNEGAPASHSWTVDTVAPTVSIVSGPADPTNATSASFSFTASEAGVSFTCQLDGGGFGACTSPKSYSGLADGAHSFQVKATDATGNEGAAASGSWTVDTVAPTVSIGGGPGDPSNSSSASFTFSASESGAVFFCQLDGAPFAACTSPASYSGLTEGSHTFRVQASDAAGNTGQPASRTWTIDTGVPAVTLTSPAHLSTTANQTPTFSGAAGIAAGDSTTVTVKVYAGSSATGTPVETLTTTRSGASYSVVASPALAYGTYTAQAEQSDDAGNVGRSSANTFIIAQPDTTPPTITLTAPANGSSTTDQTPTFSGTGGVAAGDSATVTVKVYSGSSATGTPVQTLSATRDPSTGAYAVDAPTPLVGGTYTAQAEQSDAAGNVGHSSANTFTVASQYLTEVLADSPRAYWRLGEAAGSTTAADETGTNPGSYQGGVTLGQPGALTTGSNTSASFDGVDDTVIVPSSSSLNLTTAVTLEAWVKRTRSGAWQNIVAKSGSNATATQNYALWLNTSNQPVAYFGNGSSSFAVTATAAIDTNWHHVAVTNDNSTAKLYVDGVLVRSATATTQLTANSQSLTIGRSTDNVRIFGGQLDEVAVYGTALSAARIQAHYAAATTADTTPPAVTLTTPADGALTDNATPTFSGAAGIDSGDSSTVTVKVYAGSAVSGSPLQTLTTTQSGGSWSVVASSPLEDGTYTAQAEQADTFGNLGRSSPHTFTVTSRDLTPPSVTLTTPANGSSLVDPTPTLSGAAGTATGDLPTITVKVWKGVTLFGTPIETLTTTASGGSWSVDSALLEEGTYVARAEQSDDAGNIGLSSPNSFTIGSGYRDEVLADQPAGYWRLGEQTGTTAASETGANNGTYLNGVTLGQPGALTADVNKAASFDGVDDTVSVPSSTALSATNAVTVEAWVKRTRSGAWQNVVAKPGSGATATQNYALWINTSNQPVGYFGNGSSSLSVTSPSAIDTNWHFLTLTYDNATARLYVDGVQRASVNSTLHLTANTQPLTIGRSTDNLRIFGGLIDEPAVYPTALSATRIQAHYAKANAIDTVAPVVTLTTPPNGSSTLNTVPHFAGSASTTSTDSATVTLKIYSGTSATGTPVQTLTAPWNTLGGWLVDASGALPLGTYTAQVEQSDQAGNVGKSSANTFSVVPSSSTTDPIFAGAGDIADCTDNGVNATAALILGLPSSTTVFTLGDNAYPSGTASDFANCYDPTWGQFKSRTRPAIGDHEYETPNASGYFNYFQTQLAPFGASATDPNRAYYSYDLGTWHVAVLNAGCGEASIVPACSATAQASWLDADLSAHPNQCTVAILAAPRWSSGSIHGSNANMARYVDVLYSNGADLLLGGDDHLYERFAPQDPQGFYDPVRGVRQIITGTGGGSLYTFGTIRANSEVRKSGNYGILKLVLHAGSYEWQFIPTSGSFSDSGTSACH